MKWILALLIVTACAAIPTTHGFVASMQKLKGHNVKDAIMELGSPAKLYVYAYLANTYGYEWWTNDEHSCRVALYVDTRNWMVIGGRYWGDCRAEEPTQWELVKEEEIR